MHLKNTCPRAQGLTRMGNEVTLWCDVGRDLGGLFVQCNEPLTCSSCLSNYQTFHKCSTDVHVLWELVCKNVKYDERF